MKREVEPSDENVCAGLAMFLVLVFFLGFGIAVGYTWGDYEGYSKGLAHGYHDSRGFCP